MCKVVRKKRCKAVYTLARRSPTDPRRQAPCFSNTSCPINGKVRTANRTAAVHAQKVLALLHGVMAGWRTRPTSWQHDMLHLVASTGPQVRQQPQIAALSRSALQHQSTLPIAKYQGSFLVLLIHHACHQLCADDQHGLAQACMNETTGGMRLR